ncbi:catalase [Desulfonatronum parangueonense]
MNEHQKKQPDQVKIDENSKNEQLEKFREDSDGQFLTTDQGVRVSHTDDSLKAGDRGPTLMEDFHFREKMTHFDHEPIPERVVHARGSGAHGYFQVYESQADVTMARFLQDPAVKTPVFVRFSQVVGSKGSADTVRDVRGFATKFYTEEGNYDLVGNNIPIFFIQDAIKFPDLVHSIKPEPHHEMPQASAAHDNFWDFISLMPESAHMILWLLSDRGIARSYRMMDGFGVNTYRFINKEGKAHFVKFHWKPLLGVHSLVWDEAQKLGGKDADFLRRDLWEAIDMGDYPEYEFGVQLIPEEDEFKFDFDVLDPTKIWPEEDVPVKIIGKMVLNRNPDNFFAETEQVAFHPGNVVPGIDFSNDPLLQGRLFSYLDTQIIRLGGPNFTEIPINQPLAPVHNNQRKAYHRMTINKGRVNYFPNSLGGGHPKPATREEGGYVHHMEKVEGQKVRNRSESFRDFFSQATMFWNSQSDAEKKHLIKAFHFELGKVESKEVRERMIDLLNNVDGDLATMAAEGIGVAPPATKGGTGVTKSSPAVSMASTVKDTIKSRKIAVLVSEGYSHEQLSQVMDALKSKGAHCKVVCKHMGMIKSADGNEVQAVKNYETSASVMFDAIFVPGGSKSIEALKMQGDAVNFINEAYRHCKAIGATGEGLDLLMESDIFKKGSLSDSPPEELMNDKGVVTVRNASSLSSFNEEFIKAIAAHRHWDRPDKDKVPA